MLRVLVVIVCGLNAFHAHSLKPRGNYTYRGDRDYDCYPDPCGRKPDFYWRQYTGEIPDDALIGGYDEQGYNIFVGQVLYGETEALIPANIFVGHKAALSSVVGKSFWYEIDVKILCAQNRNDYRWVPTSVELVDQLTYPIPGGTEVKKRVYIGRTYAEGRLLIGKIFEKTESNKGLWIPKSGGGETNYSRFDILVFEPKLQA